ncbi:MAG: alpha/beta fold hydrolase [Sphingobium sp.]|uniref:alpha/beta fold hydrolase n=1 Tax=Sphingobium sp. TaxID=1912891 RepID=UPI002E1A4A44
MTLALESRYIHSSGLKLHVQDGGGDGFPIICLHGGGPGASGYSNYHRNIDALAAVGRVILIDLPGYGESDKPELEGPRLAFFSGHVRAVMDELGLAQVDLIGNSLGGGTAAKLALDTPERVRRMVLLGPPIGMPVFSPFPTEGWRHMAGYYRGEGPTKEKMRAWIEALIHDPSQVTDAIVEERFAASTRPDVLAAPLNEPGPKAPFEPIWQDVGRIAHPTLILWGRDDRVVPYESGLMAFKQMKRAELHVFAETGHWVQWERTDAFNRLTAEFLSRAE